MNIACRSGERALEVKRTTLDYCRRLRFRRVLWFCAGVDCSLAQLLKTEHVALTSVGAAVLLTTVLAFVSASCALYFVFGSKGPAIVVGFLWAAIIFNLDRFIGSISRKQNLQAAPCLHNSQVAGPSPDRLDPAHASIEWH
jgi:Domain of unknown function (DUF4407)